MSNIAARLERGVDRTTDVSLESAKDVWLAQRCTLSHADWYKNSGRSVSPKTTRNICITLQSVWATAKAWRYVAHDVMEGVVLPESKRKQRFFASQQQIQLIITAANEPYRTFYGLAAETGLRPGELFGLTADDLGQI